MTNASFQDSPLFSPGQSDEEMIAQTLEHAHQPVLRVSDPVLDGAAAKIGALKADPAHGRQDAAAFVATPSALRAHVHEATRHPEVHGYDEKHHQDSEEAQQIAEFRKDLEETVNKG